MVSTGRFDLRPFKFPASQTCRLQFHWARWLPSQSNAPPGRHFFKNKNQILQFSKKSLNRFQIDSIKVIIAIFLKKSFTTD